MRDIPGRTALRVRVDRLMYKFGFLKTASYRIIAEVCSTKDEVVKVASLRVSTGGRSTKGGIC